jgi:DNA-directed RNA polymerase subunit omega
VARITIEDCNEQVGNRFNLVLMATIRAKQLMRGARPLLKGDENREIVVALREIAAGYIEADFPPEEDLAPEAAPVPAE